MAQRRQERIERRAARVLVDENASDSSSEEEEKAFVQAHTPENAKLQAELQQLRQLVQMAGNQAQRMPVWKAPKQFHGKDGDFLTFKSHVTNYLRYINGTDEEKGHALLQCIAGPAHRLLCEGGFDINPSTTVILAQLEKVYGEDHSIGALRARMDSLAQGEGESWVELEMRIIGLMRRLQLPGAVAGSQQVRDVWIKALRDREQKRRALKLRDINDAVTLEDIVADLRRRERYRKEELLPIAAAHVQPAAAAASPSNDITCALTALTKQVANLVTLVSSNSTRPDTTPARTKQQPSYDSRDVWYNSEPRFSTPVRAPFNRATAVCFNCRQVGHIARMCPVLVSAAGNAQGASAPAMAEARP